MPRSAETGDTATDDHDGNVCPRAGGHFNAQTVAKTMTEVV
jgi:hypothetical protein